MSEERTLEDFFNQADPDYKPKKSKTKKSIRSKTQNEEGFFKNFFKKRFSFDYDVDMANPTSVLYRKNYCISSIITLVNIVFFLFSLIGISTSNYIITIVFWLLMTTLSQTIGYMLRRKKDDYDHQLIIMYLQSLFVFILSVVLYIKVYLGFTLFDGSSELTNSEVLITQSAYLLIYFTLVIMSLYQDTKMLRSVFVWTFIVMLVINLTLLHPELYKHASSITELLNYAFKENKTIVVDIGLRTAVSLVYFAALYSSASISHVVYEDRRNEFERRQDVESSFKDVVLGVFQAVRVYDYGQDSFLLKKSAQKVAAISRELGIAMNCPTSTIVDLKYRSTIHRDRIKELNLDGIGEINSENFKSVMDKTNLASEIMQRLQITKKAQDIVQRFFQDGIDRHYTEYMAIPRTDVESNILLLSEIYNILRCSQSYKKELTHQRATELIEKDFAGFFDPNLIIRFVKFNLEIRIAYEKA